MNTTIRDSFIFYASFYEALEDLSDEVQLKLYKTIAKYSLTGKMSELDGISKTIFTLIKPQLDANNKKYFDGCKGGRPKDETTGFSNKKTTGFVNKKTTGFDFEKPNENENVNENVNVNENENVSLNENEKHCSQKERRNFSQDIKEDEPVSESDMAVLEKYIKRNKLAVKNVTAYARKIISNGDHIKILSDEKKKLQKGEAKQSCYSPSKEQLEEELASICDKKSAFRVLVRYYNAVADLPPPLEEIAQKYKLTCTREMELYQHELITQNSS